jgi:hypothetical protein
MKLENTWFLSTRRESLRELIDRADTRRRHKPAPGETADFHSSMYIAPEATFEAGDALRAFLEWETYRRAVGNGPVWYSLVASSADFDCDAEKSRQAALRLLGYIPVSPDGSLYHFHRSTDEVLNARHGSLRRPNLHGTLADYSPVAKMLAQLRTVRADLCFREDGIHTVLTIDRRPPAK